MVTWFWQRSNKGERALKLRSRGDEGDATRVDFEELAPDIDIQWKVALRAPLLPARDQEPGFGNY